MNDKPWVQGFLMRVPLDARLEGYVRYLETLPGDAPCTLEGWDAEAIDKRWLFYKEPRLHKHLPVDVQNYIVIPALCRMGLPKKYLSLQTKIPEHLFAMLSATVEQVQTLSKWGWHAGPLDINERLVEEVKSVIEEITGLPFDPNREPPPDRRKFALRHAVICAALSDLSTSDMSIEECITLVADRLGPGVNTYHVYYAVARVHLKLANASKEDEALWWAVVLSLSKDMRELDQAEGYSPPTS